MGRGGAVDESPPPCGEWCLDAHNMHNANEVEYYKVGTNSYTHLINYAPAAQQIKFNPFMWFDYEYGFRLVYSLQE